MANNSGANSRENAYEAAPDRRATKQAILNEGAELAVKKAELERNQPIDAEAIAELDSQLQAAEDEYAQHMLEEFNRPADEQKNRERFRRRINRRVRAHYRKSRGDLSATINSENNADTPTGARAARASRRPRQRDMDIIRRRYAFEDITDESREQRIEVQSDLDIDDYVNNHNALLIIAQKFREAEPPLLASSLRGGNDFEYAIKTAFYPYPADAEQMLSDIAEGNAAGEIAKQRILKLADKLTPYIEHKVEREQLQVEMSRDDFTKEAGNRLGKVMDEFRRHPAAALIGGAALVGAVALLWNSSENAKKWIRRGAVAGFGAVGLGMLSNMIYRSQTDDGSDLWDALDFQPDDLREDGSRLEQMSDMFPGLNIENDQAGRDLMIMLDADASNVYDVFHDAFRNSKEEINVSSLDVSSREAGSMNGKAAYRALEGYFMLLAEKTARNENTSLRGMSERQKVEEGLRIFRESFINTAPNDLTLETAILMTINREDSREAANSMGVSTGPYNNIGSRPRLNEADQATERRIEEGLEFHGVEAHVEYLGHYDGANWVQINGFPWEYTYDAERELHTFEDKYTQGTARTLNIGRTVNDNIVEESLILAQRRINQYHTHPDINGTDKIVWDETAKALRTNTKISSPEFQYLGLPERETHVGINIDPQIGGQRPYVYILNSELKEGIGDYRKLKDQYVTDRVKEAVSQHMKPVLGDLAIRVDTFDNPEQISNPEEGKVEFTWGAQFQHEASVTFNNGEVTALALDEPEALVEQWEIIGEREAISLVDSNTSAQNTLNNLVSAFAGKDGSPQNFGDIVPWIMTSANLTDEEAVWVEAINFEASKLRSEVKRDVVQAYRESPLLMLNETSRDAKMDEIRDRLEERLAKLNVFSREVNNAVGTARLAEVKTQQAVELRKSGMSEQYLRWFESFENPMNGHVAGIDLDSVGIEGAENSRIIRDSILLIIFEYSSPMHREGYADFNGEDQKKWREYFAEQFPTIINSAIHSQTGNWWIDQRYNTAAFEEAMETVDPPIRPWMSMEEDLSNLQGSTSGTLEIPFYTADYERIPGGVERGSVNINNIPEHRDGESNIDYRTRLTSHIQASTRSLYAKIDDLEYSIRADEYDNLINWRVSRSVEAFIDASSGLGPADQKILAEMTIEDLKEESLDFQKYMPYLYPEGLTDMLNPWNEADLSVLTEAEYEITNAMLLTGHHSEWDEQTQEILEWLNSDYKNEDILGFGVPWVRTDIMRLWMEKIDYGKPANVNQTDINVPNIQEYQRFFANVAHDMMPTDAFSLTDPMSLFRRTNVQNWKAIQGTLEEIPSYEEWIMLGSPSRAEVDSLDWGQNEELREYQDMRAQIDMFMDEFDSDINVAKLARFDGRWPELFRAHVEERLEGDVLARANTPDELQDELLLFKKFLHKEAVFYNTLIDSKVECTDGTDSQSMSTAAFIAAGMFGGAAIGTLAGGVGGGALGTAVLPPVGTVGGAVVGGATVGTAGALMGGLLGLGVGKVYQLLPLPDIGMQIGDQMHVRIKEKINESWQNEYVNSTSPDPDAYFKSLKASIEVMVREAIQFDASTMDMGPFNLNLSGGNIDRVQLTP